MIALWPLALRAPVVWGLAWSLVWTLASAETILGSFILARHGDRLTKPTVYLSPLGSQEMLEAGRFYHDRYFSDGADSADTVIGGLKAVYAPDQLMTRVPSNVVLQKSSVAFMQGFYPPLTGGQTSEVPGAALANGTDAGLPLGGYQYVFLEAVDPDSERYWTVEGSDNCPACDAARDSYLASAEFARANASTLGFYQSLRPFVAGEFSEGELNFGNAYTIFDYFNVNNIHNETFAAALRDTDVLLRVRTLQDQYSRALNYNASNADSAIGGRAILGLVQAFAARAADAANPLKVAFVAGSYGTFYQLFGALGLYGQDDALFTGIVDYASTAVFEVFDDGGGVKVRFGVRNGTTVSRPAADLQMWPVFGRPSVDVPLADFQAHLARVAIADPKTWCALSKSDVDVCVLLAGQRDSNLSLADAGGIGAGVTVFVFLLFGVLGCGAHRWWSRRRNARPYNDKPRQLQSEPEAAGKLRIRERLRALSVHRVDSFHTVAGAEGTLPGGLT